MTPPRRSSGGGGHYGLTPPGTRGRREMNTCGYLGYSREDPGDLIIWCISVLRPTATTGDSRICVRFAQSRRAQHAGRGDRTSATSSGLFFGASDPQSRAVTRKAEPRDPPNAECTGINWTCIGGYNHLTFTANMRAVVFVFVDLSSWRRGLCAKKPRSGTVIGGKKDRRPTQEGARRGRAGAMRVVAAVRALWLCGT